MRDETVIGVVYRHTKNDYEIMLGEFPNDMECKINKMIVDFDDGYNLAGARGDKNLSLNDANISYFETERYVSTQDEKDVVTLDQIFKRYYDIQGTVDGFENYVKNGFLDDAGWPEYKKEV